MITVAFSTRKINPSFVELLKKTSGIKSLEVLPFENNGEYSLTQVYNMALEKSSNDIVVLCHDDLYFDLNNWGQKVLNHFKRNPDYGILGVAGATKLPKSGMWWEDRSKMKGIVNHESGGKKWESKYSPSKGNEVDEVVLVDGLFIAVNKTKIQEKFDESVVGFHFYDVDFCYRNFQKEVSIGVVYDIRITHKSIGQTNEQWELNRKVFSEKYSEHLPIKVVPNLDMTSKLKVMITCLSFKNFTGSEMYVFELAKGLRKLNCEVTIVSTIGGPLTTMANKLGIKTLGFTEFPGFKLGDGKWGFDTAQGVQPSKAGVMYKVSDPDYDIIHVQHKNITDKVVEVYPKIPKIATIHSEVIALENPVKDKTIVNYIAIRPEIQNHIINVHEIPEENTQVIYNPIDDTRFNTKGIKDDGYILFVGTIDYLRDKTITELSEYAEEIGKELWIVGEMNGGNIGHVLEKPFVKYFPSTNQVEKFVKNCSETAGILLGRTTIEGWMCGKPGWIFDVDPFGNVLSKEKHEVPEDVSKYSSTEIVKQIKQYYIDTLNLWWDEREDKIESESFNKLYFNGRKITPDNTKNWGDMIPYKILKELSKSEKLKDSQVFNVKNPMVKYPIISTGSVMHFTNPDSIVWGTGCIDEKMVGEKPKKIYAVRGPLTHQELELKGWECPEVYGDPALLYPMIYNPQIEKKHEWGFIPHYIEFENNSDLEVVHHMESLGFQIIDVCSGTEKFVDELLECENIISSSLHGLIAADAYGIPNARVNVSNKLIGGDFKFKDYCYSVERELDYGYQLTKETTVENIVDLHFNKSITFDREKLLESAPWNYEENKELF